MRRVPHAAAVVRALGTVRAAVRKSQDGLNEAAAKRMAKGDYAAAEAIVQRARETRQFRAEVDALMKRWRQLAGGRAGGSKENITPLWAYFQPILQGIVLAGGECRRTDVEAQVERFLGEQLGEADRTVLSRGRERWRVMISRARPTLIAEGWIEGGAGKLWRITDAGRIAAETSDDLGEGRS